MHPSCPSDAQAAYQQTAPSIPSNGRIEAENFDPDGYFDTTEANEGGAYRTDTQVDIKSITAGHAVGWMMTGEYLEYTVYVEQAGAYPVIVRAGSAEKGRTITLTQCETPLLEDIAIPEVAEWGSFKTWSVGTVDLEAGYQKLRIEVTGENFLDLDWLHIGDYDGQVDPMAGSYNPIPLDRVRVTGGPFKHAQDVNIQYLLRLEPDRFLAPFQREAGMATNANSYPNWEADGLDGHIGGHYLTALALAYAATGNTEMLSRLNYMIDALEAVQNRHGDGYIGGIPGGKAKWNQVANGTIDANGFGLNGMWVPWYNMHKTYAGLRDAYVYTGNTKALNMMKKLADWATNTIAKLSDTQVQTMLIAEHGGMNEVLADIAALSGDTKYLNTAKRFSDRSILNGLLDRQDQLTGKHANTQIPKVIGYERIGELTDEESWLDAAEYFWNIVVDQRSVSIGGNSVAEHFNDKNDFTSMVTSEQGPETCNTYNMLKLTKSLYQRTGAITYMDYYERALYNHILSTQHPDHGGLVYFTPMRPNHYRKYSSASESMWCCVGSGIENHSKYGEMIYADFQNQFFVNLFVESTVDWKNNVSFVQNTDFPDNPSSRLTVNGTGTFGINIRYPRWVNAGQMTVKINGEAQTVSAAPGDYVNLTRDWRYGDVISWEVPMHAQAEQMPDGSNYYSIVYGPIVLANEDDPFPGENLTFISGAERWDHVADGQKCPADQAPIFIAEGNEFIEHLKPVEGQPLTFTTGDAPMNRGSGITLKPFFRIHDARYSVYFAQGSPDDWAEYLEELRRRAEEEAALESITLDKVQPGEQQPEKDHYIEFSDSSTGTHENRFWRDATGYFSYLMDPKGETSGKVRVTYWGGDSGRNFNILVNDQVIAQVALTGAAPGTFIDRDYTIPSNLMSGDEKIRIKFEAQAGSIAGGVFFVRLIRD